MDISFLPYFLHNFAFYFFSPSWYTKNHVSKINLILRACPLMYMYITWHGENTENSLDITRVVVSFRISGPFHPKSVLKLHQ